jgi:hypothetical protein
MFLCGGNQGNHRHQVRCPLFQNRLKSNLLILFFSKVYVLLIFLILISTGSGVAYAVACSDTSTGLTLATYILTCLALLLTLFGAGQFVGLSKPNSFSFAYSVNQNQVIGVKDMKDILGIPAGGPVGLPSRYRYRI